MGSTSSRVPSSQRLPFYGLVVARNESIVMKKGAKMESQAWPVIDRRRIVMRWGDMDALGHLNNTYYFRYLEQIRIDWLESFGAGIRPGGVGPVIASTGCTFLKELRYPGELDITIEVERLGRSSLLLRHRFFRAGDDTEVYASAEVALVWVDYALGRAVELPAAVRCAIEDAIAAAAA